MTKNLVIIIGMFQLLVISTIWKAKWLCIEELRVRGMIGFMLGLTMIVLLYFELYKELKRK